MNPAMDEEQQAGGEPVKEPAKKFGRGWTERFGGQVRYRRYTDRDSGNRPDVHCGPASPKCCHYASKVISGRGKTVRMESHRYVSIQAPQFQQSSWTLVRIADHFGRSHNLPTSRKKV